MLDRAPQPGGSTQQRGVAEMRRPETYPSWSRDVYPCDVTRREASTDDLSAWAKYLKGIQARPGWSVARLARESGIHRTTVFRWIAGDTENISTQRVTAIAKAAGDDPAIALQAASAVLAEDISIPDPNAPDMNDPVVRKIMSFEIDEDMRRMMLQRHSENLELQRRRWLEDLERDLHRRGVA